MSGGSGTGAGRIATEAAVRYPDLVPGTELPPASYQVTRLSLIRYCGASGDFNPIHWNERFARSVGLPDVIAHGMFTMAQAGRYLTDWAGPEARVVELGVRFSAPVVVPDTDTGASIELSGKVTERLGDGRVAVSITATSGGTKILSRARAVVQLPAG